MRVADFPRAGAAGRGEGEEGWAVGFEAGGSHRDGRAGRGAEGLEGGGEVGVDCWGRGLGCLAVGGDALGLSLIHISEPTRPY